MSTRLLDRQVSLLDYLTSSGAVFGGSADESINPALQGIDRGLLRLEACFSHEKRMEKIIAVFPRTFQILGANDARIVREFVEVCPPIDISRVENARQFYNFLCTRWRHEPPDPAYLADVAACEFAFAQARVGVEAGESEPAADVSAPRASIRRHPGVGLLRCAYNVRPIFEGSTDEAALVRRDTTLAIAIPPDAEHPKIFELPSPVFDVLAALDDWTERRSLGSAPELDQLIGDLAEHGLVQLRG
jgi:hypothetical protein